MKTQNDLKEIIKKNASKKLLPDHAISQLLDLNMGITTVFRHTAGHLMNDPYFPVEKAEWTGVFWLAEFQLQIQQEIRNRVPDQLIESIDNILINETPE